MTGLPTSPGDYRVRVSLAAPDVPTIDCSGYAESTETVEFDLTKASGDAADVGKTVKLQIKKPTKAANLYEICFQADDGAPAAILPACAYDRGSSTPNNVPCAQPAEFSA